MNLDNLKNIKLKSHFEMLRIRLIEEKLANEYSKQYMRCPTHLSIGQEAVSVGICSLLKKNDYVLSNHRAHAHYLAKGGSLKKMLAEIMGKETGCCKGRGGSMHLIDLEAGFLGSTPIVAGTIPVATGVALSISIKNEDNIVVIFFGDGATETGVFNESINFASLKKLPIIFICENNFYSVYSPLSVRQSEKRNRVEIAKANGLYSFKEYGNDIEKVILAMKKAVSILKEKKEAVFIEFDTYRYKEHCGPNVDNDLNYRPLQEYNEWLSNCPINIYQKKIIDQNLITEKKILEIKNEINLEIEEAFSWAKNQKNAFYDLYQEEKVYSK
jgi:pyruvate dehydrogenase E1 component alpha subunit